MHNTQNTEDEDAENPIDASEVGFLETKTETEIAGHFDATLKASRGADLQRGTTLVGPHRDDFLIELENAFGISGFDPESENGSKATDAGKRRWTTKNSKIRLQNPK